MDPKHDRSHADLSSAAEARRLAEQGLHEQAIGHDEEADRLLIMAQELDPEADGRSASRARCRTGAGCKIAVNGGSGCGACSPADQAWAGAVQRLSHQRTSVDSAQGTVKLARSGLWQGLGHEHDIQSLPRLPLSG